MARKATESHIHPPGADTLLSPEVRASSVIAALTVSPTGVVLAANDTMLKLIGRPISELLEQNAQTAVLARPSDWQHWESAGKGRQASGVEIQLKTRDEKPVFLRGDISALARTSGDVRSGVFVDVTNTKQMDSTLNHAARMEAVANLTSGIAHDFSNLLTILVGNLYLISEGVRDKPPLYDKAKRARDAAKRGVDLIRQLLAFARNEKIDGNALDLNKLIGTLEPLLTRALGARIKLETSIAADVWLIDANAAQLESVIVNVVINARDAIETTGTLRLSATNLAVDDRKSATFGLPPGDYVRIAIRDDGAGIPEDLLTRVFDPFFSTKGAGKGTGLGLYMVRRFAEQARGTVVLESRIGKGTTVFLVLPRCTNGTSATAAITVSKTMPLSTLPGGKETILILAEDQEVIATVDQVLKVLGYRVVLGKDWKESLHVIRANTIQLVLIDIKDSSDASALKLVQAMRHLKSKVPVVILSDSQSGDYSGATMLLKPFDLSGLATTVRRTLDGAPA
ncbi:MAG TPA: ATP-binding protein [Gammaproteobacteria bacterium]|nr:ATP-binding protein [Gammaproteobacteria bacterium]